MARRCEICWNSVVAAIRASVRASTTPVMSSDSKLATGRFGSTGAIRWCPP
jgi:hypothetical protein